MSAIHNQSLAYRPEIDGLRALAVIPVVFFHAGFQGLPGGFVGVDIFFVISGYLITAILLRELASGRFSILEFYKRRARRILPALFFVIALCLPFAWWLLTPDDLKRFGASLFSVSVFASNFYFWRNTDYFAPAAEDQPLLHTWSLSVEEQFYLFFPLLLALIYPFGKARAFFVIAAISVISFLLCEWMLHHFPVANFYLLPTRAWELLLGSLVAFVYFWRPGLITDTSLLIKNILSLAGLAMIVGSVVLMEKSTPFPGLAAVFPVLGSALIIAFARRETWVGKLLALKVLVFVGLISYSAYLWHQPIFAFLRTASATPLQPVDYLIPMVATLGLAVFSLYFIERPFRTRHYTTLKTLGASAILLALMGSAGLAAWYAQGFESRLSPTVAAELRRYASYPTEKSIGNCLLLSARRATENFSPDCFGPPGEGPRIYLLGDSHASALAPPLARKIPAPYELVQLTMTGCYPVLGNHQQSPARCKNLSDSRFDHIRPHEQSIVLLHANWPAQQLDQDDSSLTIALHKTIDLLLQKLRPEQLVIVGCVPTWSPTLPKFLLQKGFLGEELIPLYLHHRNIDERNLCNTALGRIAAERKIGFKSPMALFCRDNTCLTHIPNPDGQGYTLTHHDETHLTLPGATMLVEDLLESVLHLPAGSSEQEGE